MSVTGLATPLENDAFNNLLSRYDVSGETLAVAVSGGADSMALVLLLKDWCTAHKKTLIALTVNHGLRDESEQESQQVAGWMAHHEITHHIISLRKPILVDSSLMARARDARYDTLWAWCEEHDVKTLIAAHHADDQMETFLMRLISGSGLKGLLAMDTVVEKENDRVLLRPLLSITKDRLKETLRARGQEWIEDPTNDNDEFTRNRLRKKIIPLLHEEGLSSERMGAVIAKLSSTYEVLETSVNAWLAGCVRLYDAGYVAISHEAWRDMHMPREIHKQALSTLLQTISGNAGYPPRDAKLVPLLEQLPTLEKTTTAHGCLIVPDKESGDIYIAREWQRVEGQTLTEGDMQWDKRFAFKTALEGVSDYSIYPLGEAGVAQLIAEDIMLPALPLQVLYSFPSIWRLEKLVATPHIGYGKDTLLSEFEFTK